MAIKTEQVKTNTTPATLFIGLGGIGSDIVVKVAERCKGTESDNIQFVVMDTNANDLRKVQNSRALITQIQTSSTQSVLDYLNNDVDARQEWFPNNATLYPKTVSEGAGQVRAISRLALNTTIKTGSIMDLYKAIDNLFLKDGGDLKQALRVCIVSTAAGGTGSGIAMTVGMMVRNYLLKFYREKSPVIRGVMLLPGVMDTVIKSQSEQESLRRNGYATIKEINAFMMNASGFFDMRKELNRFKDLHVTIPTVSDEKERLNTLPFDFCFLLDRVDSREESMETLEQYKEFAAQSLYEQNIGPMQRNAFSMEDNIIKEFANKDNLGRNRFGGIGASILRYPYEDVADYIAYNRALERIGDDNKGSDHSTIKDRNEDGAADWGKYDRKYKLAMAEYKKKRSRTNAEEPSRGKVYVEELNNDDMRFGQDMKRYLSSEIDNVQGEVEQEVNGYLDQLEAEVLKVFLEQPEISNSEPMMRKVSRPINYTENEEERGKAPESLNTIRRYESNVVRKAKSIASGRGKAIFHSAPSLDHEELKPFYLENLLKTIDGGIHPNAMRYMLYTLETMMEERLAQASDRAKDSVEKLKKYGPGVNEPEIFDVQGRAAKGEEQSIDDVCALCKEDPSFIEVKFGGFTLIWEALNSHLPAYSREVIKLRDGLLYETMYDVGLRYVRSLSEEFERFYNSFDAKVISLTKAKDEIVDKLKYRKGEAVFNVCATQKHLDKLLEMAPESSEGLSLPGPLNVKIFESIKRNVEHRREEKFDPYRKDTTVDIFDDVMIQYFRESVREDCGDVIDLNIIEAILAEQDMDNKFKYHEKLKIEPEAKLEKLTDREKKEYILSRIEFGNRLASPSISGDKFVEQREVLLCAFSKALMNMKAHNIKSLLEIKQLSPVDTDTVSKYELRYFSALYNITPDCMSRFMSPRKVEIESKTKDQAVGIYYNAYQEHVQDIGPDSTKSSTISLHIDKRWDSVSRLPEINLDTQKEEMVKIHSALIYGVVHGMIVLRESSRYDKGKKVYELENMDGELTPFVVSNGTECDEFYEILDALYLDRASVKLLHEMAEKRGSRDVEKNHNFDQSMFYKDLERLRIGEYHEPPTSIFEIPLKYYNSLPRRLIDDNELSIMIDSVIQVLSDRVEKFEKTHDRAPYLCKLLKEQFQLLVENFNNEDYELKKNTETHDNIVIGMIYRKICNEYERLNVSDVEEKSQELRDLIRR